MTARALAIVASLVLNVALVCAVVQRDTRKRKEPVASPASGSGPHRSELIATAENTKLVESEGWPSLSSGSLAEVVEQLRTAGFPPRLQRAIVKALVAH
jgi:hypothetical protein